MKKGAVKPADFSRVAVDTTVRERNVAIPTDVMLVPRARERLIK